jgi:hypothetical protein
MLAQAKTSKISSKTRKSKKKTAEEIRQFLDRDYVIRQPNESVEEYAKPAEDMLLSRTCPIRKELLRDLANSEPGSGAIQWFQERWKGRIREELPVDLAALSENLRYIWRKSRIDVADHILNQWLAWRPTAPMFKKYLQSEIEAPDAEKANDYVPFECSIGAGRLVPDFVNLRAMLIQGVLENWNDFKLCSNPDCVTPYFIAKRKDQVVCDAEICKAERQREHALKWWRDHGVQRRQGASKEVHSASTGGADSAIAKRKRRVSI